MIFFKMLKNLIIFIFTLFLIFGCSKKNKDKIESTIGDEDEEAQLIYQEAVSALKSGDAYYASKKFKGS